MKYKLLLALFLISLASSLVLSLVPTSQICDPGEGCDVIQHSTYNFTFGIKNSHFGVAIFALSSLLIFWHIKNPTKKKKNLIHLAVIIGSIIALYYIYLQGFLLNAFCRYCMIVDLSMLAALVLTIIKWRD
jgi:uncharacterized membrane protein